MSKIEFAVKALLIRDGHFLAMHKVREQQGLLELPGGRIEFGETAEQTVARELMEETGLCVRPISLVDTWNWINQDWQVTGIVYRCALDGGADVRLSDEHDKYAWLPIEYASFTRMGGDVGKKMPGWDWAGLQNQE